MRKSLTLVAAAATLCTGAFAANYAIDPAHTFATFEIGHFGASVNRGRFDKKEGTISFDKAAKTGIFFFFLELSEIYTSLFVGSVRCV
jgi:polyisoprenoid-binding protein YceI